MQLIVSKYEPMWTLARLAAALSSSERLQNLSTSPWVLTVVLRRFGTKRFINPAATAGQRSKWPGGDLLSQQKKPTMTLAEGKHLLHRVYRTSRLFIQLLFVTGCTILSCSCIVHVWCSEMRHRYKLPHNRNILGSQEISMVQ